MFHPSQRNRTLFCRLVLVSLVSSCPCVLACSQDDANRYKECLGREATCSNLLTQSQTDLGNAKMSAETMTASIRTLTDEKAALQQKVDAMEKEIAKLKETPAAVSQQIVAAADGAASIEGIDSVLSSIAAFAERFPGAAEFRVLARRVPGLKKQRAALVAQEEQAKAMKAVSEIRTKLSDATDGADLSIPAVTRLAGYLEDQNLKYPAISMLPRSKFAEAMKDPDSERGKAMVVNGQIIQISKDGEYFTGLMCTGSFCSNIYHFVTRGKTTGLNQGSYGNFAGIVTQRYSYPNAGGGTTHSVALVGYFKGQE